MEDEHYDNIYNLKNCIDEATQLLKDAKSRNLQARLRLRKKYLQSKLDGYMKELGTEMVIPEDTGRTF